MDRLFPDNETHWFLHANFYDEDDLLYLISVNNEYMKIPKEQVLLMKEVKKDNEINKDIKDDEIKHNEVKQEEEKHDRKDDSIT